VEPAVRGQRIAARLVDTLECGLRAHGVGLALLETGRDQLQAIHLYERCGYTRRGAFGGYADNGLSLFFEKRL
jgi:putative acetyltransferase